MALALIGAGCSTGFLGRINPTDELPPDLPEELKEKFEIQESTLPEKPAESSKAPEAVATENPAAKAVEAKPEPAKTEAKRPAVTKVVEVKKAAEAKKAAARNPVTYPNRRIKDFPIWVGEQQVYEITYFGMLAGTLTLDVLPYKFINDRKVYAIRGRAVSSKVFSLFYTLDDVIESFIDYEGVFSHRFHLMLNETKQTRDALELYDNEKRETFYWNRWNHKQQGYRESKKFYPMEAPFPQDSISALYYLRTLPLDDGAVYKFPVVSEGKTWDAEAHVVRRETMQTPMGELKTVVVRPVTKFHGVIKQQGDSYIWLTDDLRRVVVRLEAKVKIGTVVADLVRMTPGARDGDEDATNKRAPDNRGGATR